MAEPKIGSGVGRRRSMQRSGPQEQQPDLETAIEDEMEASGRHSLVPHMSVVGTKPESVVSIDVDLGDAVNLPPPEGSISAPTARAAERERVRHAMQSQVGVLPAGREGRLRQERPNDPAVRTALDAASASADDIVRGSATPGEVQVHPLLARASRWIEANRRGVVAAVAAVVFVGAGTAYAAMRKR